MTALFFLSTYQFPHLEHFADDIESLVQKGIPVKVVDIVANSPFRTDCYNSSLFTYASRLRHNSSISNRVRANLSRIKKYCPIEKYSFGGSPYSPKLSFYDVWKLVKSYYTVLESDPSPSYVHLNNLAVKIYPYAANLFSYAQDLYFYYKPKSVHIFNGRFPFESILVRAFSRTQVVWHECNQTNYQPVRLFHSVHDLDSYGLHEVPRLLKNVPHDLLVQCCDNYISSKARFSEMPISYVTKKFSATYFTSSNDEFASCYNNPINQGEIITRLISSVSVDFKASVRVHPNTSHKSLPSKRAWSFYDTSFSVHPNLQWYSYTSPINSYQLAASSSISYSIGSSIGAELLFMGLKHIFIGNQHQYSHIPGVTVLSVEEFLSTPLDQLAISQFDDSATECSSIFFKASLAASLFCFSNLLLGDYTKFDNVNRKPYAVLPPSLQPVLEYLVCNKICLCNSIEDICHVHSC